MVTTLLIALPLVDDAISSLSASAQAINATSSNENNTKVLDNQVNAQAKFDRKYK